MLSLLLMNSLTYAIYLRTQVKQLSIGLKGGSSESTCPNTLYNTIPYVL
jgi:hypothetical protein